MIHDHWKRRGKAGNKGLWGKSELDKEKPTYRVREKIEGQCPKCDRVREHEIMKTPAGTTTTCLSCGHQEED